MPLAGKHLLPREVAQLGAAHWHDDVELTKMVATCLGESAGYVGAWHDNDDGSGQATSRDCGLMQINIPSRDVGTPAEEMLRTTSTDATVWLSTAQANVVAARRLYDQPWPTHGTRRWQPWVAYTTGWATFPAWWVWHQVNGKPVGPWLPTGRYLQRAICGVANWHLIIAKDRTLHQAIEVATTGAAHFGVLALVETSHGFVTFRVPEPPAAPPADGIGPRPTENEGQ